MIEYLDMDDVIYPQPAELHPISQDYLRKQTEIFPKPHASNLFFMHQNYEVSLSNSIYLNSESHPESSHQVQLINPVNNSDQMNKPQDKCLGFISNQKKEGQQQQRQKKLKNNNAIKKLGRIILDHIKSYSSHHKANAGVTNMMRMLSRDSKVGRSEVNKRDKFNTYHLNLLLNSSDKFTNSLNSRVTRRILCSQLRKNVHESQQISDQSKLVYLNTLKCSALRCCNGRLAIRLQMTS